MKIITNILFGIITITLCAVVGFIVSPNMICASGVGGSAGEVIEKVMPYASAVTSGLVLIIVAVMPTAKKLLEISKKLSSSNRNLQDALSENELLKSELQMLKKDIRNIQKNLEKTREMTQLGFCNMRELVESGLARNIAEVGKIEEEN